MKNIITKVMNDEEGDNAVDQLEDDEENLVGNDSYLILVYQKRSFVMWKIHRKVDARC